MLLIGDNQITHLTRSIFFSKIRQFIILNSVNNDFKKYIIMNSDVDSIMIAKWNIIRNNNEFDSAILMILSVVNNYMSKEDIDVYKITQKDRYDIKKYLSRTGFFLFSSFDCPNL